MRTWAWRVRVTAFAATSSLAAVAFAEPEAKTDRSEKADCVTPYERSQELRAAGKMREAEGMLVQCADAACPRFIHNDCTQWLVEVQRDMPTVVIAVKDERGADATHVKVTVDDAVFATELDGRALPVDPGTHRFRFEIEGQAALERAYLIKQGQKARLIEMSFAPAGGDLREESPYKDFPAPPPPREEPQAPPENPNLWLRPYAYGAAGVGVLGVVGFIALGASGKARENELRRTCVDRCNPDDVDSIRTRYVLADVSLGLGIAGLGSGVLLYLLSEPKASTTTGSGKRSTVLDVRPAPGATFVTVSGSF